MRLILTLPLLAALLPRCTPSDANAAPAAAPDTPQPLVVRVDYPGLSQGEIVLESFDPITQKGSPLATVAAGEGPYRLETTATEPRLLRVKLPGEAATMLVVDPAEGPAMLTADGDKNTPVIVAGSTPSRQLAEYDAFRSESLERLIRPTYARMSAAKKAGDEAAEVAAVAEYVRNSTTHRKELLDWTEEQVATSPALLGTVLRWTGDDETTRLRRIVDGFAKSHPDWTMTRVMQDKVGRYENVALGAPAPELSGETPDGQTISLRENLGKVTLIDFWASWCGPCISQLPELRSVYADYADRGLVIFGLSVDHKGDKWRAAVQQHDMPWLHASDLAGWDSPNANRYNVTFVPYNVLLDAEGRILAKNLHELELREYIERELGAK